MKVSQIYLTKATATLDHYPTDADEIYDALYDYQMDHTAYPSREAAEQALADQMQYATVEKEGKSYYCTALFVEEYIVTLDENNEDIDHDYAGCWAKSKIPVIVNYQAGESRYQNGKAIDYMLAVVEDRNGEEVELYAEAVNPTWDPEAESYSDDTATYDDLCVEIMNQAEKANVRPEALKFYRDY